MNKRTRIARDNSNTVANINISANCYASGNGASSSAVGDSANGGYNYMSSIL